MSISSITLIDHPANQCPSYHEILFMIDTCQANTMYSKFYSTHTKIYYGRQGQVEDGLDSVVLVEDFWQVII